MKLINIMSMCGGADKAFHVQENYEIYPMDFFYFVTSEGISTHVSEEHMYHCLEEIGFHGCLDIKEKAIPIMMELLALPLDASTEAYLTNILKGWQT